MPIPLRHVPALSLLWPRRATQNVVSEGPGDAPVRLLVTAAYDAPRRPGSLGAPLTRLDAALRAGIREAHRTACARVARSA